MANNIPITEGQGQSSVAAEQIGTTKYQQIKVVGGEVGSTSVLGVNPDRSINVSVIGAVTITGSIIAAGNQSVSGTVMVQGQAAPNASIIGNPLYIGGTDPNGSVMGVRIRASSLSVFVTDSSGGGMGIAGSADNISTGTVGNAIAGFPYLFNGGTWDRQRGNSSIGALVSTGASSVIVVGQQGASVSGAVTAPAGSVMAVRTDLASVIAVGNVASGATDSGNPVKTSGKYNSTLPTFTDGQRGDIQVGTRGSQNVTIFGQDSVNPPLVLTPGDGYSNANTLLHVGAWGQVFNGVNWDRLRGNSSVGAIVSTSNSSVITVGLAGSVATFITPPGSVQAVRTDNASVITVPQFSSIIAVPVGSVITVFQAPSIVGTYAEDSAHASADKGIFALNVRNDTLASITSSDGDYSPLSTGPMGEAITANSPITKWVQGTADLRVVLGTSVQVLAAPGASIFTYVTGVQVANMGPSSVLVTFAGGLGSILGYTIAPAGGGSNILYPNALKTGENSKFTASISGTASVLVSAQGFSSKT